MSGQARARTTKPRRSIDDRIKELQARADVVKKKQQLLDAIAKAKKDLEALRLSRR